MDIIKKTLIRPIINKKLEEKNKDKNVEILFKLENSSINYHVPTAFYDKDFIASKKSYDVDQSTFNFFELPVLLNYWGFIYNKVFDAIANMCSLDYIWKKSSVSERSESDVKKG